MSGGNFSASRRWAQASHSLAAVGVPAGTRSSAPGREPWRPTIGSRGPCEGEVGESYYGCVAHLLEARVHPRWVLTVLLLLLAGTVVLGRLVVSIDAFGFVAAAA